MAVAFEFPGPASELEELQHGGPRGRVHIPLGLRPAGSRPGPEEQMYRERVLVPEISILEVRDRLPGGRDPIEDLRLEPVAVGIVVGVVPTVLRLDE